MTSDYLPVCGTLVSEARSDRLRAKIMVILDVADRTSFATVCSSEEEARVRSVIIVRLDKVRVCVCVLVWAACPECPVCPVCPLLDVRREGEECECGARVSAFSLLDCALKSLNGMSIKLWNPAPILDRPRNGAAPDMT